MYRYARAQVKAIKEKMVYGDIIRESISDDDAAELVIGDIDCSGEEIEAFLDKIPEDNSGDDEPISKEDMEEIEKQPNMSLEELVESIR